MCVLVVDSKKARVRQRVLRELRESPCYKRLNSPRQREAHVNVMSYILEKNRKVRWREIMHVFMPGGNLKRERAWEDGYLDPLTKNELRRILQRLVKGDFLERYEELPHEKRCRPDVYYSISWSRLTVSDAMDDPEQLADGEAGLARVGERLADLMGTPSKLAKFIRAELEDDLVSGNISDAEFEKKLRSIALLWSSNNEDVQNHIVRRWAGQLPMDKKRLSKQVMKCLDQQDGEAVAPGTEHRPGDEHGRYGNR